MEERTEIPHGINSIYVTKTLQARLSYLDRKRKFQGEQLGIPPPKHVCSDQTYGLTYDFSYTPDPEDQVLYGLFVKPECTRMTGAEGLEEDSANDSNSVCADSMISASGVAEYQCHSEEYSFDQPSTSSVNSRDNISKNTMHYSESSSSATMKSSDKLETGPVNHLNYPDSGLQPSENDEDYLLEFGAHMDFSSLGGTSLEDCMDKELEKRLYTNGVAPSYVLSSGRWTVNQDNQQHPKKLTIDKEFEQYFSGLML